MDVCRACLSNTECVEPFYDNFINGYNLLTNLNIKPLDGLSQFVCQMCINTVNSFLIFREQCISSEATLKQQWLQVNQMALSIKSEPHGSSDRCRLESEIEKCTERNEKPLLKKKVGRPRKIKTTESPIKRCVGRPRKNVCVPKNNNSTWITKQDTTTTQNASDGCDGHSGKKMSKSKSSKWVICPRKSNHKIQNNISCIEGTSQNISDENENDKPLHESELLTPSKKVIYEFKSSDLAIKEEIESPDDNSVLDFDTLALDTNASGLVMELVKNEDLEDVKSKTVKPAKNKSKKETSIPCDVVKLKTISKPTKNKEEDDTSIPCGLCKKKLENQESLSRHLDSHRSFTRCEICQESFLQWQALLAHRLQHVKSRKYQKCHICHKPQRSSLFFEYHYLSMHSDKDVQDVTMTCKICSKKYSDVKKMKRHLKECRKEMRYSCDRCSKPFAFKYLLVKHIRLHSDDRSVCDICGYSSKFPQTLRIHVLRKHTETSVTCTICFRVFTSKENLERHVCPQRKGPQRKEQICPICGKVTKFLKSHMAVHSDVRKYACKRCPASFKTKGALQVHTNKHDDLRPHRCEFCPMRFNARTVLMKHRRVHTGEKPYVCKVCSKGFTANHNLKVHMRVHGEDLFVRNAPQDEELFLPGKF